MIRTKIWHSETLENIVWTLYTVQQTVATTAAGEGPQTAYGQGFGQGLERGLQHVITSFRQEALTLKVWSHRHIQTLLLTAQADLQGTVANPAGEENPRYCQGIRQGQEAALWCIATAFEVRLSTPVNGRQPETAVAARPRPDAWLLLDIENLLVAIQTVSAVGPALSDKAHTAAYSQGFEDALWRVARSFGIRLFPVRPPWRPGRIAFWSRVDLETKLRLGYQTIPRKSVTANDDQNGAYWRGYQAALDSVALALGVKGWRPRFALAG